MIIVKFQMDKLFANLQGNYNRGFIGQGAATLGTAVGYLANHYNPFRSSSGSSNNNMNRRLNNYYGYRGRSVTKYKKRSRVARLIKNIKVRRKKTYKWLKYEKKYWDNYISTDVTTAPGWLNCFSPGQGSGPTNRIGNRTQLISLQIRGQINQYDVTSSGKATVNQLVRVFLVQDRQPNNLGSTTLLTNILDVTIAPSGLAFPVVSWSNRFKIIKSEVFEMDKINGEVYHLDWFIPLNVSTTFNANNGTIDDISTNCFYLCYCGVPALSPSEDPIQVRFSTRARFYDC